MVEPRNETFIAFYQQVYPRWYLESVLDEVTMKSFVVNTAPILPRLLDLGNSRYPYPLSTNQEFFSAVDMSDLSDSLRDFIHRIYKERHWESDHWCKKRLGRISYKNAFECILDYTYPGYSKMSWALSQEELDRFILDLDPTTIDSKILDMYIGVEICYHNFKTNRQKINFYKHFTPGWHSQRKPLLESIDYEESDFYRRFTNDHDGLLKEI